MSSSTGARAKGRETGPEPSREAGARPRPPLGKKSPFPKPSFSKPAFPKKDRRDAADKRRPTPRSGGDERQNLDKGEDRPANPRKPVLTLTAQAGGDAPAAPQRIAKVMARAGACSRRDAEVWIAEGRVTLNGAILIDPAINVSGADEITVDGEPLARRAPTRLFLFHKPRGLVTTEHDPEGRPTIFDHLRESWPEGPRVISVGRLDINTEGLLLLTNDGGLARLLELPSTGWLRRYRVRAKGGTDQSVLDGLRGGLTIEGVDYAGLEATLDREQGANSWLTIALREGKNREIKRVLEHIGLQVNRLIRVSFGPFQLGEIVEGVVEEVRTRVLRDQLGPLAAKAGADFSREDADVEPSRLVLQAHPGSPFAKEHLAKKHLAKGRAGGAHSHSSPDRETRPPGRDRPREEPGEHRPAKERGRPSPQAERGANAETRGRPAPGPRKHVSVLRAGEGERLTGGRKRIERAETADRSGRMVHVERLVPAAPQGKGRDRPATRNGRRFEAERKAQDRDPAAAPRFRDKPVKGRARAESPGRRDGAPGRRDGAAPERRRSAQHQAAAPGFAEGKSARPEFAGKPFRKPAARAFAMQRGETGFEPKPEGERARKRSGPGGPPKRPLPAKGKFGSKESGGAGKPGRFAGPRDSNDSGRSKAPGRKAKPGPGNPRGKR
ncbi:pseudouridine synthase [Methylocapsa palsarum]|uniref:pseudouridine synthase n=1 Tax=Methylocapsa palsarum TaxID=1612308 RepID=UPI001FCE19A7|nr:pseudouridine synthase [Methylocapsa palsarum]